MQQYFINQDLAVNDELVFDKEQSHHLAKVLRAKVGYEVYVIDNSSKRFLATLTNVANEVSALISEELSSENELPIKIKLVCALIKGERFDFMLQKCSELGVSEIVPLQTKRNVVKLLGENNTKKLVRWNKIALEACEQSKRNKLVEVTDVISLKMIDKHLSTLNLVCYEDARELSQSLKVHLNQYPNLDSITVVIGPEGGFEYQEIEYLESLGFKQASLGKRILRAETAAISIVDKIGYHFEN